MLRHMARVITTRRIVAGAIAIGALGSGTLVARASIPAANGTINACYSTTNGAVRIVDSSSPSCTSGEGPIAWNQTGPQGPAGSSNTSWIVASPQHLVATSANAANTYWYYYSTGQSYAKFYNVNTDKCAVTASASDPNFGSPYVVTASIAQYQGWLVIKTVQMTASGPQFVNAQVNITVNC